MTNDDRCAGVTFHALVYRDRSSWDRTREMLLRFLNSVEGQRYAATAREPLVVLESDPRKSDPPFYLHVTDRVLVVLRALGADCSIFTSAFYHELPDNQVLRFSS